MEIRKDCPYCGTKLVLWNDPQTDQNYLKCENCHYKISYADIEQK
jgi:DNA-directed RNA polymerase subunit RPC12/RpoP